MLFFFLFLPRHKTCASDQNKAHATIEQKGIIQTDAVCLRTKRSRSERRLVPQSKSRSCSLRECVNRRRKKEKKRREDKEGEKKRKSQFIILKK